jgi:hypothetical protein
VNRTCVSRVRQAYNHCILRRVYGSHSYC